MLNLFIHFEDFPAKSSTFKRGYFFIKSLYFT